MSAGSLDLGTLHLKMRADKDGLKRDLKEGEREADQTGNRMGRNWWQTLQGWIKQIGGLFHRGGADAADGFWRSADGRLRDHKGRFVTEGKKIGEALGEAASDGARTLTRLFSKLGDAAGGISTLALVVGMLAAAMVFAIPLVHALGGALAALPAITTGGIAALATLLIGFTGLTEAFKKNASAGGSVVDRARQIDLAERRIGDAQREVLAAQLALNHAREEAAEQLQQLSFSLRDAKLDELDAVDALATAEKDLAAAQKSRDPKRIDEATRAYKRAELQLEMVRDRVGDLELQSQRATEAGIEGSDQVKAALERQERAAREAADATYDLERAHQAASGAAAQETTKLARSAAATVAAIKALKGEWESLRLEVQERLFAGVDVELPALWAAWEATLHTRLGSMAGMLNGLFKDWAETSRDPEFVKNISTGWESVEQLIGRVGKSIATKGLTAFGTLSAKADPFLDMLGDKLGGAVDRFGDWIAEAERTGKLEAFFDKATTFFGQIWDLGGDVIGLLGDFFSMWTDSENGAAAESTFDSIRLGLHDLREWLKDPQNRENLKSFIDGFVLLGTIAMYVLGWLVGTGIPAVWGALEWLDRKWNSATEKAGQAKDWIFTKWRELGVFFESLPERVGKAMSGMFDSPVSASKTAFNAIASMWNRTLGGVSFTVPDWVLGLGGKSFGFPKIPMLAGGGLVRATPGGRIVNVAEAGEDEIVSPVDQMRQIVAEELDRVLAGGGAAGDHGGIHVDQLIVKAYNDRFSVSQVERELAMHGVH